MPSSKINVNIHQQYLDQLPKLAQSSTKFRFLYSATEFYQTLLQSITTAKQRIVIVALYLENDQGGQSVMSALYAAKRANPTLDVAIYVDWHRAQRGRIGANQGSTNADWYTNLAKQDPDNALPVYGIPVNTREALGVLHLKGFIIDDKVIYSGASINNIYLNQGAKYRYDRYQVIENAQLAQTMYNWINENLKESDAVYRLDNRQRPSSPEIKNETRQFRQELRTFNYEFDNTAKVGELSVTPLVGLGKRSILNQTIFHLLPCAQREIIICTPYFNLPAILVRSIIRLLRQGIAIEIIIGDKTANDFYISPDEPFKVIGALPYLYEINLRRFASRLQYFIDKQLLKLRIWKHDENSFHLKGIWIDKRWMLITGNNLNPRAWRLDLENAILVHDPKQQLQPQIQKEIGRIRQHSTLVNHFNELERIADYPAIIRKLIRRLRRIRADKLISRIL